MIPWLAAAGATAGAQAAEDIRGIRGPISIATAPPWLTYVACAVAAVLAGVVLYRLWRARRVRRQTPYERVTAQLLAAETAFDPRQPDAFAERVSSAVREYVEARFALPATHRTTEEFLAELRVRPEVAPALAAQQIALGRFLDSCDFAKFAGRAQQGEALLALRTAARQLIESAEAAPPGATS